MWKATARALEEFDAWLPAFRSRAAPGRPGDSHRRPRLRPHHAVHRPQPRIRAAAGLRPAACAPASNLGLRASLSRHRPDGRRKFRRSIANGTSFLPANLMRKPIMAGNWKMYKTPAETTAFFEKFRPLVEKSEHCEIVICPPFTNLAAAVDAAKGTRIRVGAQNIALGQGRRVHRRDFRPHAQRRGRQPRDHRPQRAPPVFRRDRRDRAASERRPRSKFGLTPDRLRGRASGRARRRQHRSRARRPVPRRHRRPDRSSSSPRS